MTLKLFESCFAAVSCEVRRSHLRKQAASACGDPIMLLSGTPATAWPYRCWRRFDGLAAPTCDACLLSQESRSKRRTSSSKGKA